MTAKPGDTVKIHYTGTLDDGSIFDTSVEREPLEFKVGSGQVIPGFDEGVKGMEPGQHKTIEIPAKKAYGERREDLVLEVAKEEFPPEIKPEVGQQFRVGTTPAESLLVTVAEVGDDNVVLDANHPLAGKDLKFEVKLVEIVTV